MRRFPAGFRVLPAVVLSLLALLPAFQCPRALNPKRPITHYAKDVWRRENGLPQDSVNAILQAADGYLWLGTDEGLARFDGVDFEVYDRANTPAFAQNHVTSLCQTPDGALWAGTNGGGLLRRSGGGWMAVKSSDGLPSDRISAVGVGSDGLVWVATPNGLARVRPDGKVAGAGFSAIGAGVPIEALGGDATHGLVVALESGIARIDGRTVQRLPTLPAPGGARVLCLLQSRQGALWAGTADGLFCLQDGAWRSFGTKEGLTSAHITALGEDLKGTLWIGTPLGLNRYSGGVVRQLTLKEGLPDNDIRCIVEDREENLWVGTNGGGLVRMKDRIFSALSTTCGLCSDTVWSVYEAPDKALWIGTEDGLACYKEGSLETLTVKDGLPSNVVRCAWQDRRGDLWVGTTAGLARRHAGKWSTLRAPDPLPDDAVHVLYEDRRGTLWVGTNGGIALFDGTSWRGLGGREGLADGQVRAILEDSAGSAWIGTYGGGLFRFKEGAFTRYRTSEGLAGDNVWALQEAPEGTLWVGTGTGLSRLSNGAFRSVTEREGLFSDVIYQFLVDADGNAWMSCNKGVSRVALRDLNEAMDSRTPVDGLVTFGVSDGMSASECNGGSQPCGWRAASGKLWFATVRGAMVVDPREMKIDRRPPPIVVERLRVDNALTPMTAGAAVVPPGSKELEVDYAGISLSAPAKVTYRYRLKGFNDDWLPAASRRAAYFTKVPPGRYRFEVQARLANGPWSEVPAALDLRLVPHFYQTAWFMVLCLLLASSTAAGLYLLRVRRLERQSRELQSLVSQRTHDLQEANARLEHANVKLERLSSQDGLTGVANRRSFDFHLESAWRTLARSREPLSLIMVDLDAFKAYNDAYGHLQGDECLRRVASTLATASRRAGDLVARYGGEEFAIVLSCTDSVGAQRVAEALRAAVESMALPHLFSGVSGVVTVSLGVATVVPGDGSSPTRFIAIADQALYRAKQEGRNRCVVAPPDLPPV